MISLYSKIRFMIFTQVGLTLTVIALSYSFSGVPLGHSAEFKLLKAIRSNQTEKALELIEKKKNPWFFSKKIPLKERLDRKDPAGDSALTIAARNGNTAIVDELLKDGASVDIQDGIGNTALLGAVSQGHLEVVRSLLSYRASIGIQNQEGATALTVGIRHNRNEIVQYLLQKGANPNFRPLNEVPALSLALKCQQTDLFWALIAARANLNIEDGQGNTPLHFAIDRSNAQVATWLVLNGGHFGKGPRPSGQSIAWFQTTLLNYLSTIIDPVLEESTVAHYLYLSKVEGWLGSPFHLHLLKKSGENDFEILRTIFKQEIFKNCLDVSFAGRRVFNFTKEIPGPPIAPASSVQPARETGSILRCSSLVPMSLFVPVRTAKKK